MEIEPIAVVESPFREKFGIPRQAGLVAHESILRFKKPYNHENYFRGLEAFSHIWVIWQFHENEAGKHTATVRPPRLGGNQRLGVFATRSSFRPNSLAMSVLPLKAVKKDKQGSYLVVEGGDFIHGTPVFDVKPYVAYVDRVENSEGSFAEEAPEKVFSVRFADCVLYDLEKAEKEYVGIRELIESVLAYDPRPAYKKASEEAETYGFSLYDLNIRWMLVDGDALVTAIDLV